MPLPLPPCQHASMRPLGSFSATGTARHCLQLGEIQFSRPGPWPCQVMRLCDNRGLCPGSTVMNSVTYL